MNKTRIREIFQGAVAGLVIGYSLCMLVAGDTGWALLGLFLGIFGLYSNVQFIKANRAVESLNERDALEKLKKETEENDG